MFHQKSCPGDIRRFMQLFCITNQLSRPVLSNRNIMQTIKYVILNSLVTALIKIRINRWNSFNIFYLTQYMCFRPKALALIVYIPYRQIGELLQKVFLTGRKSLLSYFQQIIYFQEMFAKTWLVLIIPCCCLFFRGLLFARHSARCFMRICYNTEVVKRCWFLFENYFKFCLLTARRNILT